MLMKQQRAMIGMVKSGLPGAPLPLGKADEDDSEISEALKKRRARRNKKKCQLEDNFPSYLQVMYLISAVMYLLSSHLHANQLHQLGTVKAVV